MSNQTLKRWREICRVLKDSNKYVFETCSIYNNRLNEQTTIYIKHDVECNPTNALKTAQIEHDLGISATYYVQVDLLNHYSHIIREIASLGHEIGYHYDVLDECGGNYDKANKQFKIALDNFQKIGINISTVCPHGNPVLRRSDWHSNKDFFRRSSISEQYPQITDIVVDPNKAFGKSMTYISDTGYFWKIITDISNNDRVSTADQPISLPDDLSQLESDSVVISSHPHRWVENEIHAYFLKHRFLLMKLLFSYLKKNKFMLTLLRPFYHLARRF